MNPKRIAVILIAVMSFTLITIHDLRPYSEENFVTQHDSVTSHHDIFIIYFQKITTHEIQSLISQPQYHTIDTVILSYTINNLTIHAHSNGTFLFADYSSVALARVYDDEPLTLHNVTIPSDAFRFSLLSDVENTTITGNMSLTLDYTLELMFQRPPKFLISQFLRQLVPLPDIQLIASVCLILFALFLCYLNTKMRGY